MGTQSRYNKKKNKWRNNIESKMWTQSECKLKIIKIIIIS